MKYIVTDVDGVLTDATVTLDAQGNESKRFCFRDLDAIGVGRRAGSAFVMLTGENTPIARFIAKRFGIEKAYFGAKDKLSVMAQISGQLGIDAGQIVYIGDSDSDAALLSASGLGIAPHDGTATAKKAADSIADACGGTGVLLEVVDKLISGEFKWPEEIQ
jgi:YrbI family 3-deoxy-D-manno-octulosonate 8-phosphate phosphatase